MAEMVGQVHQLEKLGERLRLKSRIRGEMMGLF